MSAAAQATNGTGDGQNGAPQKVVGPNILGSHEEYQLIRQLQTALFGGVYEAKGLSTGKEFAIKVLHKTELAKAQETNSIEFCEIPLSELKFAEDMRNHENIMEVEEHFEDQYCHYCVFELCRGGDLLEALKHRPGGFDEAEAKFLIRQAAEGLAVLHKRRVAMQDVSLENMLLHVNAKNGHWQVKICDPGQAVHVEFTSRGEEIAQPFRGLVGKSFRPPELHDHKAYYATKVDSWCLGWSTWYLMTATPLFMTADPSQHDAEWEKFSSGQFQELFSSKPLKISEEGLNFIFSFMRMEPTARMSIEEALSHPWLKTPVPPMVAPREFWPKSLLEATQVRIQNSGAARPPQGLLTSTLSKTASVGQAPQPLPVANGQWVATPAQAQVGPTSPMLAQPRRPATNLRWAAGIANVPTWSAAPMHQAAITSPQRPRVPDITARSPSPVMDNLAQPRHSGASLVASIPVLGGSSPYTAGGRPVLAAVPPQVAKPGEVAGYVNQPPLGTTMYMTPRSGSRPRFSQGPGVLGQVAMQGDSRDRDRGFGPAAWAFNAIGSTDSTVTNPGAEGLDGLSSVRGRNLSPVSAVPANSFAGPLSRSALSPQRTGSSVYLPRPTSPVSVLLPQQQQPQVLMPPRGGVRQVSPVGRVSLPRAGGGAVYVSRSPSPNPLQQVIMGHTTARSPSPSPAAFVGQPPERPAFMISWNVMAPAAAPSAQPPPMFNMMSPRGLSPTANRAHSPGYMPSPGAGPVPGFAWSQMASAGSPRISAMR